MDETNPTARALRCLEALQSRPGISAGDLSRRIGVSERAARRYVAVLREAGIPVESIRGPYGGYRIGRGVRPPPLTFTGEEALGLVMAVLDGHHAADDPTDPVGRALGKILRSLPTEVAAPAEAVRRSATTAPDRAAARPDARVLATLVEASTTRHRVRLGYRSEAGTASEVDIDPWAVVVRHARWYLLCWSHRAEAVRAYRVDRVASVAPLEAAFTPPSGLDPVARLEEHLASGWEYAVEVVVEADADEVAARLPPALGRVEPDVPGRCRVVGTTGNPRWYAEQLVVLRASFRISAGEEVAAAVRALGELLLAAT